MTTASLLTTQQRKTCQNQSSQPAPNGPRAKALLALNKGSTQQQAADESGLSLGQVRYCLRRFRTVALELFDTATPAASKPKVKTVAASTDDAASTLTKDTPKPNNTKGGKKGKGKGKKLKPIKAKTEKGDKKLKKKIKKSDKKDKKGAGKKGKKKKQKK